MNKMTLSKKKPVLIYLPTDFDSELSKYSRSFKIPKSTLAEEGLRMRLNGSDNLFNNGFDAGLNRAMEITRANKGAQMKFPSGKSFAELVCEDLMDYIRDREYVKENLV
jgi:hypothetical protein